MVLYGELTDSMMQYGRNLANGINLAAAVSIDNENCIVGSVRKVRRITLQNRDNQVHWVQLCTGVFGGAGNTNLTKRYVLNNYDKLIVEPQKPDEEFVMKFTSATNNTSLMAYIDLAGVNGVEIDIDYFDDVN